MSILTDARRAIWDSIDKWPGLDGVFKLKLSFDSTRLEGPHRPQVPSGVADMPAIAVFPVRVVPKWVTNNTQDHPYVLRISYWTADTLIDKNEAIWDELIKAIYQAHPDPKYPRKTYLKDATGISMPIGVGPSSTQLVTLDKLPAVRTDFDVALKITTAPLTKDLGDVTA